jgi:hypothetical protein
MTVEDGTIPESFLEKGHNENNEGGEDEDGSDAVDGKQVDAKIILRPVGDGYPETISEFLKSLCGNEQEQAQRGQQIP